MALASSELGESNEVTPGTNYVAPWTGLSLPDFYEILTHGWYLEIKPSVGR